MNWNTLFVLLQCSRSHCGPSGSPALAGGVGKPTSADFASVPSGFLPVAMIRGTWMNSPLIDMVPLRSP